MTPENKQFVFSRHLPRTSQTVVYQAGDDGTHQAGWSIGSRFIVRLLGGNGTIFDRATGLLWPKNFNGPGGNGGASLTWANAINWANGLSCAGFTDWRLPNVKELMSIVDYNLSYPCWYDIFTNEALSIFWTSTSDRDYTLDARGISGSTGDVHSYDKAISRRVLAVRGGRLNG